MNIGRRILTGAGAMLLSSTGARKVGSIGDCCCAVFCCIYTWTATQLGISTSKACREPTEGEADADWYYTDAEDPCEKVKVDVSCEPGCTDTDDCDQATPSQPPLPCCEAECTDPFVYYDDECDECIKPGSATCSTTISVSFTWSAAIPSPGDPEYANYEFYQDCVQGQTYTWTESQCCTSGTILGQNEDDYECTGYSNYTVAVDYTLPCGGVDCAGRGCGSGGSLIDGSPNGRPDLFTVSGSVSCSVTSPPPTTTCELVTDTTTGPGVGTITFKCCVDGLP